MFEEIVGATPTFVAYGQKLHGQAPKPNHVYFSKAWPGTNKWVRDTYFEIERAAPGEYIKSYTLPGSDYKELDLSNASSGLNFYPETDNQVHEVLIGMKAGNYILQIDVPNGSPLWKLPQASMIPSKTDAALKYLGAKDPEDSPAYSPNLRFWFIKDMPAVILRPIILSGVDFEKVTFTFKVAKHILVPLPGKPPGAYDTVPYIEELRWS